MSAVSEFAAHFIELHRISGRLAQEVAESMGMTRTQLGALYRMWELERCTMSDLKHDFDVTTGAITGLIDRLEGHGLVRRVPSREDRRVVYLELTPAGVERVQAIQAAWTEKLGTWLDRLDAPTREQVNPVIGALVAAGAAPGA